MNQSLFFLVSLLSLGCAKDDGVEAPNFGTGDSDGDCADYRTAYPSGPYGFAVGDIMADPPGMVDATGTAQSVMDIFSDRTKRVLVFANAFET